MQLVVLYKNNHTENDQGTEGNYIYHYVTCKKTK